MLEIRYLHERPFDGMSVRVYLDEPNFRVIPANSNIVFRVAWWAPQIRRMKTRKSTSVGLLCSALAFTGAIPINVLAGIVTFGTPRKTRSSYVTFRAFGLVYTYDASTSISTRTSARKRNARLCLRRPGSHVAYACACVVHVNQPFAIRYSE